MLRGFFSGSKEKVSKVLYCLGVFFAFCGFCCLSYDPADLMLQTEGGSLIVVSILIIREGIKDRKEKKNPSS